MILGRNTKEMFDAKLDPERERAFNNLADEMLKRRFDISWPESFQFHEDTAFVSGFYLGRNGLWLSTNYTNIESLEKGENKKDPIEYFAHNADIMKESYALMALVDMWVQYSESLKEK